MKYRKKPVEIEAFQFFDRGFKQMGAPDWFLNAHRSGDVIDNGDHLIIKTLEGDHRANPGDWIIRGIKGELYRCKPDIFAATYDPV